MAMAQTTLPLATNWSLHIDRGPDWLFIRPAGIPDGDREGTRFAEEVWHAMRASLTHRVVLELDGIPALRSQMIGQLVLLCKRIHQAGGTMRIAGLSARNEEILRSVRLHDSMPCFADRTAAIMGIRKAK